MGQGENPEAQITGDSTFPTTDEASTAFCFWPEHLLGVEHYKSARLTSPAGHFG